MFLNKKMNIIYMYYTKNPNDEKEMRRRRDKIRLSGLTRNDVLRLVYKCIKWTGIKHIPSKEEYRRWLDNNSLLYPLPEQFRYFGVYYEDAQAYASMIMNNPKAFGPPHVEESFRKKRKRKSYGPRMCKKPEEFSYIAKKYEMNYLKIFNGIRRKRSARGTVDALLFFLDMNGYLPKQDDWDKFASRYDLPSSEKICVKSELDWDTLIRISLDKANNKLKGNNTLARKAYKKILELYWLTNGKRPVSVTELKSWTEKKGLIVPKNLFMIMIQKP